MQEHKISPTGSLYMFSEASYDKSFTIIKWQFLGRKMKPEELGDGDAGDQTLCLSHAKRALYHLSYIPIWFL